MPSNLMYTVKINGTNVLKTPNLTEAIRAFDFTSASRSNITGGIEVREWSGAVMVRDGWILKVEEDRVFLNPNLTEADIACDRADPDVARIRSAKAQRDAFRSRMASSKSDLIDSSFDTLMKEC